MNATTIYHASCFCGGVAMTLTGEPEVMAYCHCDSCRRWSAGRVSAFTLWKPESLAITRGAEQIASYEQNPRSDHQQVVSKRKWCKVCGGHLYTDHPTMGLIDVPSAVIDHFHFEPAFHVHYQESVQPIRDGLPKFKDLPKEAGGSGDRLSK
ncbi:GFA family protein [Sedimenticola hydrogenitrophicus]|uniref:GFA family protein n=1 Tax=Sedimenticola hydrogenitrophicus TaxID=2967975 RepID=UPI0023B1D103|nr:GFA family protein [Sedimenticola hydrogenitrophicus]